MGDIRKHAVELVGRLHLRDGNDELLYAEGADGQPDKTKPMVAVLYSPGSKIYAAASAAQNNRLIDMMKAKGKTKQSEAEAVEEKAEFLTAVTKDLENVTYDQLEGKHLFKAVYLDREIGFIASQVSEHLGDWGNFTKKSPAS